MACAVAAAKHHTHHTPNSWHDGYDDIVVIEGYARELSPACLLDMGGVIDGAALQAEATEKPRLYCALDDLKYGQTVDIVKAYPHDHPQHPQKQFCLLITFALGTTFLSKG